MVVAVTCIWLRKTGMLKHSQQLIVTAVIIREQCIVRIVRGDKYMTKEYVIHYKCNEGGSVWSHLFDDDDYNNDYTQCPKGCDFFDFDEISEEEFKRLKI